MIIGPALVQPTSTAPQSHTVSGVYLPSITQALHAVQDADTALLARNASAAMTQHRQAALTLQRLLQRRTA